MNARITYNLYIIETYGIFYKSEIIMKRYITIEISDYTFKYIHIHKYRYM